MKILVTGANGYIGQRLINELLKEDHEIFAMVRHASRLDPKKFGLKDFEHSKLKIIQADLLEKESIPDLPQDLDVAFYLVHSMSGETRKDFQELESISAKNFSQALSSTEIKQVIYLGGIANADKLSKHIQSRAQVEDILREGKYHLTVLRAAIIIGSGSASFEIIRDLVEKLPIMVAPKWLQNKCQPIALKNVLDYLMGAMLQEKVFDKVFDIGGPDILDFKSMLLGYAKVRKLKRFIITVPVLTPRLSSYWLVFVTSVNYALARTLVSSLKNDFIVEKKGIEKIIPIQCCSYEEAIKRALVKVNADEVFSSWKDAFIYLNSQKFIEIEIPQYGCFFDKKEYEFTRNIEEVKDNIWSIGGNRGWYFMNWAWKIRGFVDIFFGGGGLKRGRRGSLELNPGDALDFWRVLKADRKEGYLALYAEMKLPGEAWLEFRVEQIDATRNKLTQIATFRPQGLLGRLYWYAVLPAHFFIFSGMAKNIINYKNTNLENL